MTTDMQLPIHRARENATPPANKKLKEALKDRIDGLLAKIKKTSK